MTHVPEMQSVGQSVIPAPYYAKQGMKAIRREKAKASLFTRRAYARTYCRRDIIFSTASAKVIHKGIMCNYSPGGMYIESARHLPPGSRITVKLRQAVCPPSRISGEEVSQYQGEIVWCRRMEGLFPHRFGAGIKFDDTDIRNAGDKNQV